MMTEYIVLDLETTGLNPAKDRILEIGAAKIKDGEIKEQYQTFLDVGMKIPEHITALTGITDAMAKEGKQASEAIPELLAFCGDLPLLGHNILFDYSFVKRAAVNQNLSFEKEGTDTLKIARVLLPELEKRSLEFLCGYYGIDRTHAHRAIHDALATKSVYERLRTQFPEAEEGLFLPKPLVYQVKKQSPITISQKGYLNDLLKYHKMTLDVEIDTLTKNEASRIIDEIISTKGRMFRSRQ